MSLLSNYDKHLKKNPYYNKKNIDEFFSNKYVAFFFSATATSGVDEISLFKKLFMITLSTIPQKRQFFTDFKLTLFKFFNCFICVPDGLHYFNENYKDKTIFDNYFIFLFDKIKLEITLSETKQPSPLIYEMIKESNFESHKLLYKILVKSGIDESFLSDKYFFYYFFSHSTVPFSYKNKIILEKKESPSENEIIDPKYPFLYSCSTTKEQILLEIERKAFLKAVEMVGHNKKKEFVPSCFFKVENLKNWDIHDLYDKRFMIFDSFENSEGVGVAEGAGGTESDKVAEFLENFLKKQCSDRRKYMYYKISFIYYLTLSEYNNYLSFCDYIIKIEK